MTKKHEIMAWKTEKLNYVNLRPKTQSKDLILVENKNW